MTTTLDALKAAREALRECASTRESFDQHQRALTLLDAAIQREEAEPPSGVVSREGLEEALREYDYESTVRSQDRRHQANQGFRLARALRAALSAPSEPSKADWTTDEEWIDGFVGDLAHDEGLSEKCAAYMRRELAGRFREVRSLSAPSEPMVPRARAMEAARESYSAALQGVAWGDSERLAARILDGEASDDE